MIKDKVLLLKKILNSVEQHMNESSTPSISNLQESITWFERVLLYKTGIKDLDGTSSTLLSALDSMYVRNDSLRESLTTVAAEVETYLEKILYLVKGVDYTTNKSFTLINMIDELELSEVIKNRTQPATDYFNERKVIEFIGEPYFVEHIARTYIKRNDIIHNSPDYDIADIFVISRSFLIVMLFATTKHLDKIKAKINDNLASLQEINDLSLLDVKTEAIYNFISHGNNTREIKEQIIEAFVLHSIFENGDSDIEQIVLKCNDTFNTNFSANSFERRIEKYKSEGKLEAVTDRVVKLSEEKQIEINENIEHFRFQEVLFKQNISDVLAGFHLAEKTDEVYLGLNKLIEANYKIDLEEVFDRIANENRLSIIVQDFKDLISKLLKSRNKLTDDNVLSLILELLVVCQTNDFLYKKCSGVVYSNIANPNGLQSYVRQLKREVYLDANVLIFVICNYYIRLKKSKITEYNVVKDLLDIASNNSSITLISYSEYVIELAYQIRSALLLIPFENIDFFSDGYISNNVFYKFYRYLSEEYLLDPEVENFEGFMEDLGFYYDDLFESNPLVYLAEICEELLGHENIEVKFFDNYDTTDLYAEFSDKVKGLRVGKTIANDVQMISFLSDWRNHELDPYFVTYDSVFFKMRKYILGKKKRAQYWHLYFPSRFVAHLNLLEFKIDAENFTNDFMSILTKSSFADDTSTLVDIMSDFMDIRSDNKRKLIKMLAEFSKKYTNVIDSAVDESEERSEVNPVGELLKEISYHYRRKDAKHNLLNVKRFILSTENHEKLSGLFDRELEYFTEKNKFRQELFEELDEMIEKK